MPRPLPVLMLLLSWSCLAAASIQVDFQQLRGSALAQALIAPLVVEHGPAHGLLAAWTLRIQIRWEGRRGLPRLWYDGPPAATVSAGLAATAAPLPDLSPRTWPLPSRPGFGLQATGRRRLLVAPLAAFRDATAAPGRPRLAIPIRLDAAAEDLNLGDLAELVSALHMAWYADGHLRLRLQARPGVSSADISAWVLNRLPLLQLAALVGIEDARFPARLLSGAQLRQVPGGYEVLRHMDTTLLAESHRFLRDLLERRFEKYAP